jgi:hypothetical protein
MCNSLVVLCWQHHACIGARCWKQVLASPAVVMLHQPGTQLQAVPIKGRHGADIKQEGDINVDSLVSQVCSP